jgi:hypothetical protein
MFLLSAKMFEIFFSIFKLMQAKFAKSADMTPKCHRGIKKRRIYAYSKKFYLGFKKCSKK